MSTITERARRELHQRAEATLGKEAADTLMAYLPPVGYADVATKSDVELLRAEMAAMESRLIARMQTHAADVAEKFAAVAEKFSDVNGKFSDVSEKFSDVNERIAEVHEAIAKVHEGMATQARWFVVALSGTVIAVSALPQVVDRLLGS